MRISALMSSVMALCLASTAYAQSATPYQFDPVDIQRKAAHFMGGIVGFAAVECKLYTSDQAVEAKRKQQQKAAVDGLPAAEFEALYAQGYKEASQQWGAQPTSERASACGQIRQLVGSVP